MDKITSFRGPYHFLSNFYDAPIKFQGVTFENNEAAFQAMKLLDVKARESFSHLDPSSAKKKGFKVQLRSDWERVKDKFMYEICLEKFRQNEHLQELLLQTGDSELVEGNTWGDKYWGVYNGVGKNKLGKILMSVREKLREDREFYGS